MSENETSETTNPACGCFTVPIPGLGLRQGNRHTRKCLERGRDKMNAEEVAADMVKEQEEDRAEARSEFVSDATKKLDAVLPTILGALDASKELRPKLPWKELADELRGFIAGDLAPFGKLFRDAGAALLWDSAKGRADTIKRLFKETDLPMEICVQIVLASALDLSNALKNLNLNTERDKKK